MFDDVPANLPTGGEAPAPTPQNPPQPTAPIEPAPAEATLEMPEPTEPAPAPVAPEAPASPMSPEPKDMFADVDAGGAPTPQPMPSSTAPKKAGGKKVVLIVIGVVVIVGIISAISVFMFFKSVVDEVGLVVDSNQAIQAMEDDSDTIKAEDIIVDFEDTKPVVTAPVVELDSDGDGLSDSEEAALGTSSRKPDTDNDGLFDRDEVKVYFTNPLVADTDGDGFMDGPEVANGYNPNGEGKLLEIPTK